MKYHAVIAILFWVIIGLEVGAVVSLITQTPYLVIGLGILIVILGGIWLAWSRIANPVLEQIRKRIEVSIVELDIDTKQEELRVVFGIRNKHRVKLTLKSIDKVTIRLNKDIVISTAIQVRSENNQFPRCKLVKVVVITPITLNRVTFLETKNDEIAYWDFCMNINFDSAWGDLTSKITDLEFNQIPRLGRS